MNEEMHICKHCGAETHQSDDVCYANPNLSSKKLSAVDWLINEFRKLRYNDNYHLGMGDVRITLGMLDEIEYQAKAMEKEQIEKLNEAWAANREQTKEVSTMIGFSKGFNEGLKYHDNYYQELDKTDLPEDIFHKEYIDKTFGGDK